MTRGLEHGYLMHSVLGHDTEVLLTPYMLRTSIKACTQIRCNNILYLCVYNFSPGHGSIIRTAIVSVYGKRMSCRNFLYTHDQNGRRSHRLGSSQGQASNSQLGWGSPPHEGRTSSMRVHEGRGCPREWGRECNWLGSCLKAHLKNNRKSSTVDCTLASVYAHTQNTLSLWHTKCSGHLHW